MVSVEGLSGNLLRCTGSFLQPGPLSKFRNVDLFHRCKLQSTLLDAVAVKLNDKDWHVRRSAVKAFGSITIKGDRRGAYDPG